MNASARNCQWSSQPARHGSARRPLAPAIITLLVALASLGFPDPTTAQPFRRDSSARVERLAQGVYAIIHDDPTEEWQHGNTGIIVGDDGVMIIDATYYPSRARADIALIRSITNKPVRYLVNTHFHRDHVIGNATYRAAFPGVAIVGQNEARRFTEVNTSQGLRSTLAADSPTRQRLRALEATLASGRDSAGASLSPEVRERLATNIRQRRTELSELAAVDIVAPDLLLDRELVIYLGQRRVELRNWGRANSPADIAIYLPGEQVLFAGDILVQSPLPYTSNSWPVQWIDVLRQLEAVPVTAIVLGHGPTQRDHTYTRQMRELLQSVSSDVEALARQGRSLDQIQDAIDVEPKRARVPAWLTAPANDWRTVVRALIERSWRGVRGQG